MRSGLESGIPRPCNHAAPRDENGRMIDAPNPFRRILLVKHHRHPSQSTLVGAVELARRARAQLTFAHALEGGDQIDRLSQAERLRELKALLVPHLDGFEASYRLMSGDLSDAAAQAAGEFDLLLPAEGEPGSEAAGRNLVRLLRTSPLPVWLSSAAEPVPRGILAAIDLQTSNPIKLSLNLPILRRALLLASLFDARLDVLSIWTPPPISERLARKLTGAPKSARHWREDTRARLEELLEEARQGTPSPALEPRLLVAQGQADTLIAQAADSASIDLLVAGCLGRSGLEAWLVGDTAERLSHRLDCSILAVKSDPARIDEIVARGRTKAA